MPVLGYTCTLYDISDYYPNFQTLFNVFFHYSLWEQFFAFFQEDHIFNFVSIRLLDEYNFLKKEIKLSSHSSLGLFLFFRGMVQIIDLFLSCPEFTLYLILNHHIARKISKIVLSHITLHQKTYHLSHALNLISQKSNLKSILYLAVYEWQANWLTLLYKVTLQ